MGKIKAGSPEAALYQKFIQRCRGPIHLDELSESGQEAEGVTILKRLKPEAFVITLDERGQDLTSPDLSTILADAGHQGKWPTFVIGGADGLSDAVRARADLSLRFGWVVWPHQLIRGMLAEQIYRVQTILDRHPYHRM